MNLNSAIDFSPVVLNYRARFLFSTHAFIAMVVACAAALDAANLHLDVQYAGSYDSMFNPLPGSPPCRCSHNRPLTLDFQLPHLFPAPTINSMCL